MSGLGRSVRLSTGVNEAGCWAGLSILVQRGKVVTSLSATLPFITLILVGQSLNVSTLISGSDRLRSLEEWKVV